MLHANHEGSVVAFADCWGNQIGINAYDEWKTSTAYAKQEFLACWTESLP